MKTFVRFRSSQFPAYTGEEESINPGLWGRRLAEHLAMRLAERGINPGQIVLEDWGCLLPVDVDGHALEICCGHQDGDEDEFLIFTNPDRPVIRRWFRRVDVTQPLMRLTGALADILDTDPEVRNVEWGARPG